MKEGRTTRVAVAESFQMKHNESTFKIASGWHPAILAMCTLYFALSFILGVVSLIQGLSGLKMLCIGAIGLSFFGRSLYLKYEKEAEAPEVRVTDTCS